MRPHIPVPVPPHNLNWERLVPFIAAANEKLARYDGIVQTLINPDVLLSPLTTKEAVLSSKIEGTQATVEEVWEYEAGLEQKKSENILEDIQEILNYRQALEYAEKELEHRPVSLHLIKQIHHILMQGVRGKDKSPGEFRNVQNWIGPPGSTMETARFVPPPPMLVDQFMEQLIEFMNGRYADVIVQLAISHAQFEIIHPFKDGNGRIGRLLIPLFLYEKKKIIRPVFYMSEYLEQHRTEYYNKLRAITEKGDWQAWVEYFLKAVVEQAESNLNKAKQILDLYEELKNQFVNATHSQYAIYVLDAFFTKPIIDTKSLQDISEVNKNSLRFILKRLLERKIIKNEFPGAGRKPAVYSLPKLLSIIE